MSVSSSSRDASLFVGRDRELARLRRHLGDALAGQGTLVLIGDEMRIGKTALLPIFEQATAAHLMEELPDGTRTRFTHALIWETLYQAVALPRRHAWRGTGGRPDDADTKRHGATLALTQGGTHRTREIRAIKRMACDAYLAYTHMAGRS